MLNHFQTQLDKLDISHGGFGFIHILVEHLSVLDGVRPTGSHWQDVIQRRCVGFQQSPGEGASMLLVFQQPQDIGGVYWTGWSRLTRLHLRMYRRFTRGR